MGGLEEEQEVVPEEPIEERRKEPMEEPMEELQEGQMDGIEVEGLWEPPAPPDPPPSDRGGAVRRHMSRR
jgi:hypothetical protein